jgi:protocatechuate 3,4-dioxygenase, alpha subunit
LKRAASVNSAGTPSSSIGTVGLASTDADGGFRADDDPPGPVPGHGNTLQAPHIAVALFARGLLKQLFTRIYFEGGC